MLRADLGLVLPAALCGACLAFAFTVNDFSVPDYVSWVGPKFNVYADEVFAAWKLESRPGRAVALALPLVALTLATLIPALALRRKGAMGSLDSDFRAPEPLRLGAWRWPADTWPVSTEVNVRDHSMVRMQQVSIARKDGPSTPNLCHN